MASALVLVPAIPAIKAALLSSSTVTPLIGTKVHEQAPQPPTYPYVLIESAGEAPLNTLGPSSGLKWGGVARVDVRIVSQQRNELQGLAIVSAVKGELDGAALTLSGFGRATALCDPLVPVGVTDIAGVLTREWVLPVTVTAHQS